MVAMAAESDFRYGGDSRIGSTPSSASVRRQRNSRQASFEANGEVGGDAGAFEMYFVSGGKRREQSSQGGHSPPGSGGTVEALKAQLREFQVCAAAARPCVSSIRKPKQSIKPGVGFIKGVAISGLQKLITSFAVFAGKAFGEDARVGRSKGAF